MQLGDSLQYRAFEDQLEVDGLPAQQDANAALHCIATSTGMVSGSSTEW